MKRSQKPSESEALRHLAEMAERVVNAFTSGHNPTFTQIENLKSAVEIARAEKICGHSIFEDCDCC